MKKFLSLSIVSACILALASCGGEKDSSGLDPISAMYDSIERADSLRQWGPPTAFSFEQAYDTSSSVDGMRITLEGYVAIGSTIYESGSSTSFHLFERSMQRDGDYVSVSLPMGSGNNEMKSLPDDYTRADLKIKDDKGNDVSYGSRVRVTGIFSVSYTSGSMGTIDLQSLELLPDTAVDYSAYGAKPISVNPNGNDALDEQFVVAEGYLEVPMFITTGEECDFNLLPSAGSEEFLNVDILMGTGPNMVEDIPDNFAQSDIKVHAADDQIVGKKKVRVYGYYWFDNISVEYIEIIK